MNRPIATPAGMANEQAGVFSVGQLPPLMLAVLTSHYGGPTVGYSWTEIRRGASSFSAAPNGGFALTGDRAFDVSENVGLTPGTRVLMSIDRDQASYVIWTVLSAPACESGSGSGSGSGCTPGPDGFADGCIGSGGSDNRDPIGVRDVLCIRGRKYVTRGRLQIVMCDGRPRADWYALATTQEGCCSCEGEGGSGSGTPPEASGCGDDEPGELCGCDGNQASSLAAVITVPAAEGCAELSIAGNLGIGSGSWGGNLTGGGLTADAELVCENGGWVMKLAVMTAECDLVAVSIPLAATSCDTLEGSATLGAGRPCAGPITVSIDHPCPNCEDPPIPIEGSAGDCPGTNNEPTVGVLYSTEIDAVPDNYTWFNLGQVVPFGPILLDVTYSIEFTNHVGTDTEVTVVGQCNHQLGSGTSSAGTFCVQFATESGGDYDSIQFGVLSAAGATLEFRVVQAACS